MHTISLAVRFGFVVILVAAATAALAQSGCPVCEQANRLRDGLRKIEIGNAAQRAQGEALSREGLALVTAFRDNPPSARQGRSAFEALVALGAYAAPFSPPGEYANVLADIGLKDADYRKRYQALVRKGMRSRDRRESCQVRLLQTNVSMQECVLEQRAKGETEDTAHKRCDAIYDLGQCLAKKK
jgi:hypothetical protein